MDTILVLTDFSKRAEHAAEFALEIAKRTKSEVLLYNAVLIPNVVPAETGMQPYYENYATLEKESLKKLETLAQKLRIFHATETFTPVINYRSETGSIGAKIQTFIKEREIGMIVMGDKSKEGIIDRFIFGSDTFDVIDKSTRPVILIPEEVELLPVQKIAFATDLASPDYKALHFLAEFAAIFDAEIVLIHVSSSGKQEQEVVIPGVETVKNQINYSNIRWQEIEGDNISKALAEFVQMEHMDMLTMIHRHRPFFERIFHASKTKEVLSYHKIPLMVFPDAFI
jgi:nucleotide-binding universal stress UspA family protein